jgi:hypothetical protein
VAVKSGPDDHNKRTHMAIMIVARRRIGLFVTGCSRRISQRNPSP